MEDNPLLENDITQQEYRENFLPEFVIRDIQEELAPAMFATFDDFPSNTNPFNFAALTDDQLLVKIVTILHSEYSYDVMNGTNNYPPVEVFLSKFGISKTRFNALIPRINASLVKRGYEPYTYELEESLMPRASYELDPFFVIAVDLLTDTIDKRSTSVKLKNAGLTSVRFNALMKDKKHYAYFKKLWDKKFPKTKDMAEIALSKNVEAGDLQSIKYFNELQNIYRPETEISNMGILIARLMEILVQYIKPDQLQEVADKFEGALNVQAREVLHS